MADRNVTSRHLVGKIENVVVDSEKSPHRITRRSAIAAATVAAIIPASASAAITDPHPAWLAEWRELDQRFWNADDEQARSLAQEMSRIIELIVETPAHTKEGMIAKIQAVRENVLDHIEESCEITSPKTVFLQVERFLGAMS